MIDRLILPMSNVCVACLREGIVDNADVVDGAVIFGTGYAPFRGGPLNYARTRGVENVVSTLRALTEKFGEQVYARCRLGEFQVTETHVHAPPQHRNRAARRSLHPHAGDAGRHQRQWRYFRRLAA